MNLAKFGDLAPGTIWKNPDTGCWWLKVNAMYVYSICSKAPDTNRGWSIQIAGPGAEDAVGLLHWTWNDRDVIVWDGKEELK